MRLSIIIPAYNEETGIGPVIQKLKSTMEKTSHTYEIIVVNDGSSDKTGKIAKSQGIKVIEHPCNRGYGASLKTGIKRAKYDWILITDADGTYPVEDIPKLLKYTDQYDMVVGARTGKSVHIPLLRRPAKWFLLKMANYISKTKIPDINSGMRVFRKGIASRFMGFFPPGFSFTTTITLASLTNDYSVKYVPINYHRRKGRSSISPFRDFIGFFALTLKMSLYFSPMRIFTPASVLLILLGIVYGVYQFITTANIAQLPIIFLLAGIQIGAIGLLADMIVKRGQAA